MLFTFQKHTVNRLFSDFYNIGVLICCGEMSDCDDPGFEFDDDYEVANVIEPLVKPGTSIEDAFSDLKKSEFYEDPKEAFKAAAASSSSSSSSKAVRPGTSKSNPLLVSTRQRGNPLLKAICNVPWEYAEVVPDYVMGRTTCALFLSLQYHNLNPDYINERLKQLGKQYELRVLLVQVDSKDPHHALKNLTRISLLTDVTLMLAWSPEEAGRIIETYKIFEHKPPDMIMESQKCGPYLKLVNALTSVRSVNKTDATSLLRTFGSFEKIVRAPSETLGLCPGFGLQKAARLHNVLHQSFLREKPATGKMKSSSKK